jgi:hypothetical protein
MAIGNFNIVEKVEEVVPENGYTIDVIESIRDREGRKGEGCLFPSGV